MIMHILKDTEKLILELHALHVNSHSVKNY